MKIPEINNSARALIFDLDGTLADTMPLHFTAWQKAAAENNFEFPEEFFLKCAGMPTHNIISIINEEQGLRIDPERFSSQKEKFFLNDIDQIKGINSIIELVYQNYEKLPMAIGTGGNRDIACKTINILGLDKYIPILVSCEDVENHKPAPDTFLKCAELMGIKAQLCQVFEDGDKGIKAAVNAGMMVTDVRPFYNY